MLEAGLDEAGRCCFAGPVFAAAVILSKDYRHPLLNDSKQLTERQRDRLRPVIENDALAWAVAEVGPETIGRINILRASILAMQRAVAMLRIRPGMLLVDSNRFDNAEKIPFRCVVGGDGKFANIAAASILAKTHRDERMCSLSNEFPNYGCEQNKGYPTRAHRLAIMEHGLTVHHRVTFAPCADQLRLF